MKGKEAVMGALAEGRTTGGTIEMAATQTRQTRTRASARAAAPLTSIETGDAPLRVLIADDHPLVLIGIRRALEGHDDIEVAGEAHSGNELLALIERRAPDVVLMDLRMPDVEGESCITQIVEAWPHVKIVVLSACDDRMSVDGALAAGAHTYVVKSVNALDIASVLRQIRCGAVFHAPSVGRVRADQGEAPTCANLLTERESAILGAVARGLTTKSISTELWVSEHTVKFHLTNIYRKLGVPNRSAAVRFALENGLAA